MQVYAPRSGNGVVSTGSSSLPPAHLYLPAYSIIPPQEFEILKSFRKGLASLLYLLPAERGRCCGEGHLLLLSVTMEEVLPQCFLQVGYGSRERWLGEGTGTDLGSKSFEERHEILLDGGVSARASGV